MAAYSAPTSTSRSGSKLKRLTIDNVEDLISLPRECLHQLLELKVRNQNLVSTDEIVNEIFTSLSSSLRTLEFTDCGSLRTFAQGLEHLTAMERLVFDRCNLFDLSPNEQTQLPWKNFTSLHSLQLDWIPELTSLPSGLQHLTNLRSLVMTKMLLLTELPEWISCFSSLEFLELHSCPELNSLPEAFCKLTSLNHLQIIYCHGLRERCQRPNGRDWPKIQHIPYVYVI